MNTILRNISLNALIQKERYADIRYGIKLANKNIGFNGVFYTFPYFLSFFLKRFLRGQVEQLRRWKLNSRVGAIEQLKR